MNRKKWIASTRELLERDRQFLLQNPREVILKTCDLEGPALGEVTVELTSIAGYLAKRGVFELVSGVSGGWQTLKSATQLYGEHVEIVGWADAKRRYAGRYLPFTPAEMALGNMIGLVTGPMAETSRAIDLLQILAANGRFPPRFIPLLNFSRAVADLIALKPLPADLIDHSGPFREILLAVSRNENPRAALSGLANFHRSEIAETDSKIGLFAWEPFDFFPIEIVALIKAAGGSGDFADEILQPEFVVLPSDVSALAEFEPLLIHLRKLRAAGNKENEPMGQP